MTAWKSIKTDQPPRDGSDIVVGHFEPRAGWRFQRLWHTSTVPGYMGPDYAGYTHWFPLPPFDGEP